MASLANPADRVRDARNRLLNLDLLMLAAALPLIPGGMLAGLALAIMVAG